MSSTIDVADQKNAATKASIARTLDGPGGTLLVYTAAVFGASLLSSLLIVLVGGSPLQVVDSMLQGSVGSMSALGESLNQATPIMIVAVGTLVAYRAGVFNIGQEGQFVIGGLAGAAIGTRVTVIGGLPLLVAILAAAAAGGAIWALLAAVMKYWRGIHETVTTLLMNLIAYQLVSLAVNRQYLLQMQGRQGTGNLAPQTDPIPIDARLPQLLVEQGARIQSGILLALILTIVVALVLRYSEYGFNIRMLGENSTVAQRVGVSSAIVGGSALALSGAMIGLGGGVLLSGAVFRVQDGFSNNIGWEGLLVAQIALRRPIPVIWVSLFWGALTAGGGYLVTTGLSRDLVDVVKGFFVLALLVPPVYLSIRQRRRAIARAGSARA